MLILTRYNFKYHKTVSEFTMEKSSERKKKKAAEFFRKILSFSPDITNSRYDMLSWMGQNGEFHPQD